MKSKNERKLLPKSLTGIPGLDEITGGGFPTGRPTLICGNAGCGKTLLAMEFLVRGATVYNEPGVFIAFEETENELAQNVSSLGFDLDNLVAGNKILIDHVHLERSEIQETGEYDLEGLFVRIGYAIDKIGAKRIVLDTLESLFAGLPNHAILRSEIRRLFRWLKDRKMTAVITAERGDRTITREGLEEYVSDCAIVLDHRVSEQSSTRRIRILKYRGTLHGTNEYPFLIDENGFSVLPITSLGLTHEASDERISSGVPELDAMLGNKGYFKGSSIMVSGTAGTGKSSLAAHFVRSVCSRGEKVVYFALEESPSQIIRNMRSIGIDLEPFRDNGLLLFHAMRPTFTGLEMHLSTILKVTGNFKPEAVIIDPLNGFISSENSAEVKSLAMRIIDFLKLHQITGFFTSLTSGGSALEHTNIFVSSLIDTWLLLRDIEIGGERNRGLHVIKSRGMDHSNQIREFLLTSRGIVLRDAYIGNEGVLTGSARVAQEAKDRTQKYLLSVAIEQRKQKLERRRKNLEAQINSLKSEFEAEEGELKKLIGIDENRLLMNLEVEKEMAISRKIKQGDIKNEK
jgi:circadian clock protein KaiC